MVNYANALSSLETVLGHFLWDLRPLKVAIKSQKSEFHRLILPVNDNFVLQKCKLKVASEYQTVKSGVPQSFILGHLLFLLYQGYLSLYPFADDTDVFFSNADLTVKGNGSR